MSDSPLQGWSLDAYISHNEARRQDEQRFQDERDRRYSEVKNAEEKALKIKEEADRTALGLQRDNQLYRDEKANELREQISSERGLYVRRDDLAGAIAEVNATVKPIVEYVSKQQGGEVQRVETRANYTFGQGMVVAAILLVTALIGIYAAVHRGSTATPTPAVACTASYHPTPCPQP